LLRDTTEDDLSGVMAGLDPATHLFTKNPRVKPAGDA
jgi:hypothetical protein